MTPDERLTAYALNDPSLTAADRQEVEGTLRADPAARRALEETLKLAHLLTTGLAAEQAALPAEPPVAIPSSARPGWRLNGWTVYASAAAVLVAVFGGVYALTEGLGQRANSTFTAVGSSVQPTQSLQPTEDGGVRGDHGQVWLREAKPSAQEMTNPAADGNPAAEGATPGDPMPSPTTAKRIPGPGSGTPAGSGPGIPGGTGGPGPGMGPGGPAGPGGIPGPVPATLPAGGPQPGQPDVGHDSLGKGDEQPRGDREDDGRRATNDRHLRLVENPFVRVEGQNALSTFGVDVDTASYAIVRKYLSMGQLPPASAVRLEELVNYFPYQDKPPQGDDPFAVTVELAECPWQPKHRLARIGVKARPIAADKRPPSNLVFLIDVSGSMSPPNRLPLVKASLKLLVHQLGENDRVAMVVYAGTTGLVLDSTSAMHKDRILAALDRLEAGGSTNGSGGIQQAYAVATANFVKGGTNRVILCTDGDWNVGTTSTTDLVKMVEEKRQTGVFLSVFGFGMGNLRDEMLVQLAGKGNGNYGYIDTLKEAHKALVEQLGGTLVTVAKDVKIQVEFNPAVVGSYRLLGYEKRVLAAKDFADDKKDAGEMGAGHVVTALYELVPAGAGAKGDGLRYQPDPGVKPAATGERAKESFVVKMRHKKPDGDKSTLREMPVTDPGKGYAEASEDFRFAAAVASFALLLRDSPHKGESSFALVQELAEAARKHDPSGYRAEFMELIRQAKAISGRP